MFFCSSKFKLILQSIFNGSNILGFKAIYPGRIASFTGDELKIGGFYFGFIMLAISYLALKTDYFYFVQLIFIISLLIGETNFLSIFFFFKQIYLYYFLFFLQLDNFKRSIFFIIFF